MPALPAALPSQSAYDAVVVGAGFAGLACAKRAAQRGLRTLVIERRAQPGRHVRTTGILVEEAQREWPAPESLVRRISDVKLYAPSHRHIELNRDGYAFFATDTPALMRHLVDETQRAGAEVRLAAPFRGYAETGRHMRLNLHDVSCRFLVGADGVNSQVARSAGLSRNAHFLKGVEWEYEALPSVGDCLHCFVDPRCAPGYMGWVIPGVGITQVGLAVQQRGKPDLAPFIRRIDSRFGLAGQRIVAKRGGMIPTGGLLRDIHRDRVLLIGDAAGMVSPLTAGGIHNAYRYGRLAADAIADHLQGHGPHPGEVVKAAYRSPAWKQAARWCHERLPLAWGLEAGLLTSTLTRRLAGKVFFGRSSS